MGVTTEVLDTISQLGGWVSPQQIIDRLPEVDPQMVKFELRELVQRKRLQSRSGIVGMEYAMIDTPAPAERPDYRPHFGRPLMKTAEERAVTRAAMQAERPKARIAHNKTGDIRAALLEGALDDKPRSNVELRARILNRVNACQTKLSAVLRALEAEGIVERVGTGSHVRFRKKLPHPAPAAPADKPTVSDAAHPAQDNNGGRCARAEIPTHGAGAPGGAAPAEEPARAAVPERVITVNRIEIDGVWFDEDKVPEALRKFAQGAIERTELKPAARSPLFALWSDGRLHMVVEGEDVILSRHDTRELFKYLDRLAPQEPLQGVIP